MKPIERTSRGRTLLNHENRIQSLERRIPIDYPFLNSILLGTVNPISFGDPTTPFGWTFPADCDDPSGLECEDEFVTSGDYLFLPTGFNGPFLVTMQCARGGGTFTNYLTPVNPGDPTPTNDITFGFIPYVAEDNVVDTGSFVTQSWVKFWTQEPPLRPAGGTYDRVWTHVRGITANAFINESRRWALWPYVLVYNGGPFNIQGLSFAVTLYPQDGWQGQGQWSG